MSPAERWSAPYPWNRISKTPCAKRARRSVERLRDICGYCGDGDAPPGERCRDCAADYADVRARWDG